VFTGLIQSVGQLQHLSQSQLKVTCTSPRDVVLQGIELGDSIAVDGVCLTVEKILPQGFVASASLETLNKSTLGKGLNGEQVNVPVNLESSLRVGSKIGGHFVTGHVDGIGQLEKAERVGNAWAIAFRALSDRAARYIVNKGSIAVNGISLTVAECSFSGDWFSTAVIPVTYHDTNLQYLRPGDWVNLEGDLLGKYVEKFSRGYRLATDQSAETEPARSAAETSVEALSMAFLSENGYL
jgi:riboflavin synthase